MIRRLSSLARKALERFEGRSEEESDERIDALYATRDYLDAYSEHTDMRVERDPRGAVGGMWRKLGKLQFRFLVSNGLRPEHKLLDIGCGTLRGGRHFVGYLNAGNYTGVDISPKAIEYAKQLVAREGLLEKRPRLLLNEKKDLRFEQFNGETFDYLLAQSVFTHLKREHIEECFRNVGRIMHPNSLFFFTFNKTADVQQVGLKDFRYPLSFFQSLAERGGFALKDLSREYGHPMEQSMAVMSTREAPDGSADS